MSAEQSGSAYEGREQALVKHTVLRRYLQRLAFKVGQFRAGTTINYIDGFSGPWDATQDDHGDSSPAIALRELSEAKDALARAGKAITVRAMFVERDRSAFERLEKLCRSVPVEAISHHGEFEAHINDATRFATRGPNPFAFVFIDPTGWTGIPLQRIKPLLQVTPSEVLINFMWGHIGRFIDDVDSTAAASFDELFGEDTSKHRAEWRKLEKLDREDAVVRTYCERVRAVGKFDYCVNTVIVKPVIDRTHYHLVFATRSLAGLTTFREAERAAMSLQQETRAEAKQRLRQSGGQKDLFDAREMDSGYFDSLRQRYQTRARRDFELALTEVGRAIPYDRLLPNALQWPMTSEADVKRWIKELEDGGRIELLGLAPRTRVPKVGAGHGLRRLK